MFFFFIHTMQLSAFSVCVFVFFSASVSVSVLSQTRDQSQPLREARGERREAHIASMSIL